MDDYNHNLVCPLDCKEFTKFIDTFTFSPSSAKFVINIIIRCLNVVHGYSMSSIRSFTTYDFVNIKSTNWNLSTMEMRIISLYIKGVSY